MTYDHTLSETTCRDCFRQFKDKDLLLKIQDNWWPEKFEKERYKALSYEDLC